MPEEVVLDKKVSSPDASDVSRSMIDNIRKSKVSKPMFAVKEDKTTDQKDKPVDKVDNTKTDGKSPSEPAKPENVPTDSDNKKSDKKDDAKTNTQINTTTTTVVPQKTLDELLSEQTGGKFTSLNAMVTEMESQKSYNEKILKDDFIRQAVEYYNQNGNLTPYLEAKGKDYSKMEDDDLIRAELREQNPEYSPKSFDRIYSKEMEKYNLPEDSEPEDVEFALEEKRIRANRIRAKLIEKQKKFLEPSVNKDESLKELEKQKKAFVDMISADDNVKGLFANKKIAFNIDKNPIALDVENPEDIFQAMIDPNRFYSHLGTKEGGLNYQKIFKVYQHAIEGEEYDRKIFQAGWDAFEKSIKNTKIDTKQEPDTSGIAKNDTQRSMDMIKNIRSNLKFRF